MRSNDVTDTRGSIGNLDENETSKPIPARSPVVFVFLDPWTLGTCRHLGMVRRMQEDGFHLLDFEFKTLSEADAEEIYRTNHPIREGNSWHVARLVYPMGRSLGLLLGVRDASSCACSRMQRLKGKANPSLNKEGQLRYDFLAPNRCLSLMHSSDDLSQVRREGSVFFAADRIESAYRQAHTGIVQSHRPAQELDSANCELGIERMDEPGLGTLFARIRLRLAKELHRAHSDSPSRCTVLMAYRALWEPLSTKSSRGPVIMEAKQYLQLVAQEKPLLDAIAGEVEGAAHDPCLFTEFYRPLTHEPSSLLHCLRVLNDPRVYTRWDSDSQFPQNLLHDRWEQLLFKTHLFNFDDMLFTAG